MSIFAPTRSCNSPQWGIVAESSAKAAKPGRTCGRAADLCCELGGQSQRDANKQLCLKICANSVCCAATRRWIEMKRGARPVHRGPLGEQRGGRWRLRGAGGSSRRYRGRGRGGRGTRRAGAGLGVSPATRPASGGVRMLLRSFHGLKGRRTI